MEFIILITVSIVLGMYITTQIKENVDARINNENLKKNIKKYDEKEKTKQ